MRMVPELLRGRHHGLEEVAQVIAERAGLDAPMLSQRALRAAHMKRMRSTGERSESRYLSLLRSDAAEQAALLEEVVVHETSFFRDTAVFQHLLSWCLERLAQTPSPLRILSAPCSTGEEAYSVAAMLWEAGIPLDRFTIDAVDISSVAVERARAATYGGLSLRNIPEPRRANYLEPHEGGWRVLHALRARVKLRVVNLAEAGALHSAEGEPPAPYDLILSRNLLLYLHPAARRQVAETLHAALAPDGRLVLGMADWGTDLQSLYHLELPVECFALRPIPVEAPESATEAAPVQTAPVAIAAAAAAVLEPAEEHLAQVTALYRSALRAHQSGREREAERICRQALYLEPAHVPSLELLEQTWRRAPARLRHALAARISRHREARKPVICE